MSMPNDLKSVVCHIYEPAAKERTALLLFVEQFEALQAEVVNLRFQMSELTKKLAAKQEPAKEPEAKK